jgi:hypothetical protein
MSTAEPNARRSIDFQALIPRDFGDCGFAVNISRGIQLGSGDGAFFTAGIVRRRFNAAGRELKGERVITICGKPGESLPALLRDLARLFEQSGVLVVEPDEGEAPQREVG